MRLARPPRITREYVLRTAVDFMSIRGLYAAAGSRILGPPRSLACLFEWQNIHFWPDDDNRCAMLEIPSKLPVDADRDHKQMGREFFSHATCPRKLTSVLNAGVFLISRAGEGGVKTVNGVTCEGVGAFEDSWADRSNHASYSCGTENASDGLLYTCSIKCVSRWEISEGSSRSRASQGTESSSPAWSQTRSPWSLCALHQKHHQCARRRSLRLRPVGA